MGRFAHAKRTKASRVVRPLSAPPVPCPNCGRLTRAKYQCTWCNKYWDMNESRQREIFKRRIFANSPKTKLRKIGYR